MDFRELYLKTRLAFIRLTEVTSSSPKGSGSVLKPKNRRWPRQSTRLLLRPASGLHVLINNAEILITGPLEVLPLAAIRREFDVNVFGALSVINAFLPDLRTARGRIVQVST